VCKCVSVCECAREYVSVCACVSVCECVCVCVMQSERHASVVLLSHFQVLNFFSASAL